MKRKQEHFQKEVEELKNLISQEIKDAIGFEEKATGHINQLYAALFSEILRSLGEPVENANDFSFSGFVSGLWSVETKVFTEIQGNLGSKELFTSRLQKIHQACNTNKIPANTDMIKITQKILGNFNYLKSTADNAKTADERRQQKKQKLIELTKNHNELAKIFNTPFNPFEPFEAQGYKNLAREDATLKGLMAKRQEFIEASRPYLDKSQDPVKLAQQNQQLEILNRTMHDNSEKIAQRAAALSSLIGIYDGATVIKELELASVFNPLESRIQKTDKQLIKLKTNRQELIEKSMSFRGIAQDSGELNAKIKQLLNIKSKLLINSAKIEKREEILHNKLLKKSKPRAAVFMTEQEVADERAAKEVAHERAAQEAADTKAAAEKKRQEYKKTFEETLSLREANEATQAKIKLIDDRYPKLVSQMASCYAIHQDSTVKSLRDAHLQLLNRAKNQKLAENDPATLQQVDDLQNEKTNLIAANDEIENLLNELTNSEQKLEEAIVSAKKRVEVTKTSIANKIKSIEDYIAPFKDKNPYESIAILRKNAKGISHADHIILKQKSIAAGFDLYSSIPMNDRARHALKNLDDLTDALKKGFLQVHTQYQAGVAKLRGELNQLKSIKICNRFKDAQVVHFKTLESELEKLENSCKKVDQLVDQEKKDQLTEKMKETAISLGVITSEMASRKNSEEIKIVRELIAQINNTIAERKKEIDIDDKAPINDLIVNTLIDFRTQLIELATDYLDLKERGKAEVVRVKFITNFLDKMQTTLTEDKIQDFRNSTNSNIFIDFINFIADLFSSLEPLIANNNKKPVYRAQFWPSPTEGQITQAATKAHDALSALQTQQEQLQRLRTEKMLSN